MNRTTILKPRVQLKIDGKEVPVVDLQLNARINCYPSVHVVTFQKEDDSSDKEIHRLATEDVMAKMQKQQEKMIKQTRSEADAELLLRVDPGKGTPDDPIEGKKEIKMKGYTVAVTMHYSPTGAYKEFDIIPDYCEMDVLNFAIYDIKTIYSQSTAGATGLPLFEGKVLEYMPKLVHAIMKEENLPKKIEGVNVNVPNIVIASSQAQHKLNLKVIKHFDKLLANSNQTFGWEELPDLVRLSPMNGSQYYDTKIPDMLTNALKMRSESFLRPMLICFDSFQTYYRPHWDDVGEIVNWTKAEEEPVNMTIFPTNITIQAGQRQIFPPKYILVQDDASNQGAGEPAYTQTVQMLFATGYPKSQVKEGATCMGVSKPVWFPGLSTFALNTEKGKPDDARISVKPATGGEDIVTPMAQAMKENYDNKVKLLEEWARCCYHRMALSGCNVRVELPLTLGLEIGYYYTISGPQNENGGQGKLFEGILESVQHRVQFGTEKGLARTTATFTRVRVKDFELPG